MSWIEKIKESIFNDIEVGLVWFIEELDITIKPYSGTYQKNNKYVIFKMTHSTEGFGDNEIMTKENAILGLQDRDRPDMIMINGKEI